MTGPITAASDVGETIARHPSTGPIFIQHGRLYASQPGGLYATYPARTLAEYARFSGLALEPLLELLNAAVEAEQSTPRAASDGRPERDQGGREQTPPMGAIGYTGTYREPSGAVVARSVVSELEARGPE
jgi:hypothetical protein